MVKRTERGWRGHFILSDRCLFSRNTLLEYGDIKIVVSTVGNCMNYSTKGFPNKTEIMEIGYERYYETMAFHSNPNDGLYHDADVTKEVQFDSPWSINEAGADNEANDMHETAVAEIAENLLCGHYRDQTASD